LIQDLQRRLAGAAAVFLHVRRGSAQVRAPS